MWSGMNSLNIVSRLTATPSPPSPPQSRTATSAHDDQPDEIARGGEAVLAVDESPAEREEKDFSGLHDHDVEQDVSENDLTEKTPLLSTSRDSGFKDAPGSRMWALPWRIGHAVLRGVQVVYTTITAPGRYVIACFYDDKGHFSAILPLRNFKHLFSRRKRRSTAQAVGLSSAPDSEEKLQPQRRPSRRSASVDSNASSDSKGTSDGDADNEKSDDSPARHTRSRTAAAQYKSEEGVGHHKKKSSIKIRDNGEALRKRSAARAQQKKDRETASPEDVAAVASALKSPSSSATTSSRMTRYPRAPHPPRPLVPRRQPSYTLSYSPDPPKKTLIIDLDETLIHSLAKGGRMSTGHMVEVRLGGSLSTGSSILGPGVPILYYVHERPHCHEFLRKVSKWYNLVVFTASVQEYADPVIDWLERERRYFLGGRYYRQHCTLRNGAYIKDLAQVEPDLSRVMILDNSPMSYIFHEGKPRCVGMPRVKNCHWLTRILDNAIPIEGWISDPTDNDLLHLVPLLEGLQYVTDVRALLALRQGQAQQA